MVKFRTTLEEEQLLQDILDRAEGFYKSYNRKGERLKLDRLEMEMDLVATHSNGCPLNFRSLINFDDFNFFHDLVGIQNNINRKTGKLDNHFLPRCAKIEE